MDQELRLGIDQIDNITDAHRSLGGDGVFDDLDFFHGRSPCHNDNGADQDPVGSEWSGVTGYSVLLPRQKLSG